LFNSVWSQFGQKVQAKPWGYGLRPRNATGLLDAWCFLVLYGVFWCFLVFSGVFWCFLVLYDAVWCFMVLYDAVWCFMGSACGLAMLRGSLMHGVCWCFMVLYGALWALWGANGTCKNKQ